MRDFMSQIRRLVAQQGSGNQSDELLLTQFLQQNDQDAFAVLVRRHGPMVLGVCLRLLHHHQDAEDAFQATFLTLVRKGHSIREHGALPAWLYRVAFRISVRIRSCPAKRIPHETLGDLPVDVDADPAEALAWKELRPVLDAELNRLPRKYRVPMILCYLEGKTYEQVAAELGCPKGTVAVRLLRARNMLKARLLRRGLLSAAGYVAGAGLLPPAQAAVPPLLSSTTLQAATNMAGGMSLALVAPAAVVTLVREATQMLAWKKIGVSILGVLILGMSGTGFALVSGFGPVGSMSDPPKPQIVATPPAAHRVAEGVDKVVLAAAAPSGFEQQHNVPAVPPVREAAPVPANVEVVSKSKNPGRIKMAVAISGASSSSVAISGTSSFCYDESVCIMHGKVAFQGTTAPMVVVIPLRASSSSRHASGLALRLQCACLEGPTTSFEPGPAGGTAKPQKTKTIIVIPRAILVIDECRSWLYSAHIIIISSATSKELGLPEAELRD
jgi:RNA polymerase sigma factor (sigma-70 family)